ncbi:hypothetical protein IWX65_002642 [Arthrobacter sp. CAN_A214]
MAGGACGGGCRRAPRKLEVSTSSPFWLWTGWRAELPVGWVSGPPTSCPTTRRSCRVAVSSSGGSCAGRRRSGRSARPATGLPYGGEHVSESRRGDRLVFVVHGGTPFGAIGGLACGGPAGAPPPLFLPAGELARLFPTEQCSTRRAVLDENVRGNKRRRSAGEVCGRRCRRSRLTLWSGDAQSAGQLQKEKDPGCDEGATGYRPELSAGPLRGYGAVQRRRASEPKF